MRTEAPFRASDLEELDARLYSLADRVVPMRDMYKGDTRAVVIGLRHDVDDNIGSFETALRMAEWEFEHGYSSTYFLLHDSHYWRPEMLEHAPSFEELGHEVGIHVNAIAEALRQKRDPHMILSEALERARATGVRVVGCVAHGDNLCHKRGFVNDEMFEESPRPDYGGVRDIVLRRARRYTLVPLPRHTHALEYDANWLPRGNYLSDSGGRWSQPFDEVVESFGGWQLHMLIHPDWWAAAFVPQAVTV